MTFKDKIKKIKQKILAIKNKRYYKKVFIFDDNYYNSSTGKTTNRAIAMKGIVVQKSNSSVNNYLIKTQKANLKYIYKMKNKKYLMSSSLTTNFLERILFDHYESNMFVVRLPSYLIIFFGEGKQRIISISTLSETEINNILFSIFQGLKYVDMDFTMLIGLMNDTNYIIPIMLIASSALVLYLLYNYEQNQLIKQRQWQNAHQVLDMHKKHKKQANIINPLVLQILNTNMFIKNILNTKPPIGSFVGNVNFGNHSLTLYSLAPMRQSQFQNNFFQQTFLFQQKSTFNSIPFSLKTIKQCLTTMGSEKKIIHLLRIGKHSLHFSLLSQNIGTTPLYLFLKKMYGCPMTIRSGIIQYQNINTRSIALSITLYQNKKGMKHVEE